MNTLYFCNGGDFDVRAMLTFGVSAKDNDDAIGYFGTGFKYAVAIILRLGGKIAIESRGKQYKFEARKELVRGEEFEIVYMNGREAGFTTRLGINWEPWHAFRELYCNCTDEHGEVSTERLPMDTVITVDCADIMRAYRDRDQYFVSGAPIEASNSAEVHENCSDFIFYRGVAVMMASKSPVFSYNIKDHVDLTEDRTVAYKYQPIWAIQKTLQKTKNVPLLRRIFSEQESFECTMGFDTDWGASDEFVSTAKEFIHSGRGVSESVRRFISKMEDKAGDWPEFALTVAQQKMMDRAIWFLESIGVDATGFPIKTVTGLGDDVMGRAMDGTIYLSEIPFQLGTKQVASTLLEEWVHNRHGCADFDRKMQSWLFDKVLSIGEEKIGEPI